MTRDTRDGAGCGREELLVTVLYGEASATEREEFTAHRSACKVCDEEFAAFSELRGELRGWEVGTVPRIRVEIRPGLVERFRRSLAMLPVAARVATAGACALLLLAVFNTEVTVGGGGVTFKTSLLPQAGESQVAATAPAAGTAVSLEQVEQLVAERADQVVRAQLAAYRTELDAQIQGLERQLVAGGASDDVKRLTVQVKAQRRKIDQLERDLDRTAGYGGTDLFSVVLNGQESGN